MSRELALPVDEYLAVSRPFAYTLHRLLKYDERQEDRRSMYLDDPEWLFRYTPKNLPEIRDFLDTTYRFLSVLNNRPDISPPDFHTDTGVVSRVVASYIQEVKDADTLLTFLSQYHEYMIGERKRFPANVSPGTLVYRRLKRLSKNSYGLRLIEANRAKTSLGTQDYTLFRIAIPMFIEQVLAASNNEDIVKYIDRVRLKL